jgi:hypothetical protein
VASLRELVRAIEDIQQIPDDDVYRGKAEEFLFDALLLPSHDGNRYDGPRCGPGLWGAEVRV